MRCLVALTFWLPVTQLRLVASMAPASKMGWAQPLDLGWLACLISEINEGIHMGLVGFRRSPGGLQTC